MPLRKRHLYLEFSLLGLLAILWGSSYLFTKIAVTEIPPVTVIALRVSIAAIFLIGVLLWRNESLPKGKKIWGMLFIQALFNSILAWTILAWGQQYLDSGLASVLNSTSPIFVFLFTFSFSQNKRNNLFKFCGAIMGLLGVILIVGVDVLSGIGQQVAGQLAAITGAILYAFAAIYGRKFSELPHVSTAAGTMIWATVVLVPASLVLDQPWTLRPSTQAIMSILISGVFCTGIALLIYFRLIKTLGSLGVASQAYLRAGVGVLLGVFILNEEITLMVGIGLFASIVGVAMINMAKTVPRT